MEQASTVGVLRGDDSTGVFQVDKANTVKMHKLALPGGMFAETKQARKIFQNVDSTRCTILHHRAATRGDVSHENAHPFEHSDEHRMLVGVHNGGINNARMKYDGMDFSVDSDYALYRIFQEGKDAFKELNGAYAFVWWENDGKVRVVCNGERAFAFAPIVDKNVILMASEAGMLWWLASRNGIQLEQIVSPEPHQLFTFDPTSDLRKFEMEEAPKFQTTFLPAPVNLISSGTAATGAVATAAASAGSAPRLVDHTAKTLYLRFGIKGGDEVEFFPNLKDSTALCIKGEALIDINTEGTDLWEEKGPVIVEAILNQNNSNLYNNIRAGMVESLIVRVRGETTVRQGGKAHVPALMLGEVVVSVGPKETPLATTRKGKEHDSSLTIKGPKNRLLTYEAFNMIVEGGCANCKSPISIKEGLDEKVAWTADSKPVCSECMTSIIN